MIMQALALPFLAPAERPPVGAIVDDQWVWRAAAEWETEAAVFCPPAVEEDGYHNTGDDPSAECDHAKKERALPNYISLARIPW